MARSTKSKGKGGRSGGKAGGSGGRADRPAAKTAARDVDKTTSDRPAASAREAAAKAVSKPPLRNRPAKAPTDKDADKAAPADLSGTAKATATPRPRPAPTKRTTPPASGRYTPPVPKSEKVSPLWVPIVMFACLGIGMMMIILNYVNVLPGPEPSNAYLMAGLALITVGFITATKYH